MLTAADERGLKGLSLDGRVRRAFYDLSASAIWDLAERLPVAARNHKLLYYRDGQEDVIPVILRPTAILAEQMNYFHTVSLTLLEALKRVADMYLDNAAVREAVPLDEVEEQWLRETWTTAHRNNHCVFGRLDALVDFTSPSWKDTLAFVEPNLVGVGGINLVPAMDAVMMEVIVPALQRVAPDLQLEARDDCRELFMDELRDHAESIGRKNGTIALVDAKYSGDGPAEFAALAEHYTARGYTVFYCDPSELRLQGTGDAAEVFYEDTQIDLVYRDYAIHDFADPEYKGDVNVAKLLFKRNQMVSSLAGEFDHKSTFELLTDPRFANLFTPGEKQMLRRHVLWTRVLRERKTTDPHGDEIDLLKFTRENRDILVIKPNRSYGGDSIYIGPAVSDAEWLNAIDTAIAEQGQWVVQRMATVTAYEFPVVHEDRSIHIEPFYMVVGFAPTKYGTAVLGRASQKQVVNVAQKGGMCAVLVGRVK
jgi:diaminobutyrate-2-oxoglutarate transaminase